MKPKTVFTNGVFDVLHVGHLTTLWMARSLGDRLIVGVNSDRSVEKLGKEYGRPIIPAKHRAAILSALRPVDKVVVFEEETPERLIREIRPDVLVKGGDYAPEDVVGKEFVESYGGTVEIVARNVEVSSTEIFERIRSTGPWPGPYPEGEPWIGFDLDGTLAYYEPGFAGKGVIGPPIESVLGLLRQMVEAGENVAIVTARISRRETEAKTRELVEGWLLRNLGRTLPITNRKDFGMTVLFDDRVVELRTNEGIEELPPGVVT